MLRPELSTLMPCINYCTCYSMGYVWKIRWKAERCFNGAYISYLEPCYIHHLRPMETIQPTGFSISYGRHRRRVSSCRWQCHGDHLSFMCEVWPQITSDSPQSVSIRTRIPWKKKLFSQDLTWVRVPGIDLLNLNKMERMLCPVGQLCLYLHVTDKIWRGTLVTSFIGIPIFETFTEATYPDG